MSDTANRNILGLRPDFDHMGLLTPLEDLQALSNLSASARRFAQINGRARSTGVEVGTWTGQTAIVMAQILDRVFCVDPWTGNQHDPKGWLSDQAAHAAKDPANKVYGAFHKNCQDLLWNRIFPIPGHSPDMAAFLKHDGPFDLVYIDGEHRYEDVKADINAWWPLVAERGILAGHDFCDAFPGVIQAVTETFPGLWNSAGRLIWYVVKPMSPTSDSLHPQGF